MKILGIVGSPRRGGNTDTLIQAALNRAAAQGAEVEKVYLCDFTIGECLGCNRCNETCRCVLNDGMQDIYRKLEATDGLILGSPTYFYQVTGLTKLFLDRLYAYDIFDNKDRSVWLSPNELFGMKYAVTIAVCEQQDSSDMGYTSIAMDRSLQAVGYRIVDSVKALHLFAKGEAAADPQSLQKAETSSQKLVTTLKLAEKMRQQLLR